MRQQTQAKGTKKRSRFPPSIYNICTKCKQDVGIGKQINKHKCEVVV